MADLHPAGFIDTGSCTGPNLIRSQPSRSSSIPGGGLGNSQGASGPEGSSMDYYLTEQSLNLPYKNLISYTREIENQWPKLDPKQKDIISNTFSLFFMKNPEALLGLNTYLMQSDSDKKALIDRLESIEKLNRHEKFANELALQDVFIYLNADPRTRTLEVLNNLRQPADELKADNSNIKEINNAFKEWLKTNNLYIIDDSKKLIFVIILAIFLFIGICIGAKC